MTNYILIKEILNLNTSQKLSVSPIRKVGLKKEPLVTASNNYGLLNIYITPKIIGSSTKVSQEQIIHELKKAIFKEIATKNDADNSEQTRYTVYGYDKNSF
jgi:hypothetical protein